MRPRSFGPDDGPSHEVRLLASRGGRRSPSAGRRHAGLLSTRDGGRHTRHVARQRSADGHRSFRWDALPGRHRSLWSTDVDRTSYAPLRGETRGRRCGGRGRHHRDVDGVTVQGSWALGSGARSGPVWATAPPAARPARSPPSTTCSTPAPSTRWASASPSSTPTRTSGLIGALEELADRHGVDAYPSRHPSYVFSRDASTVDAVRAEAGAARRLGLPASFVEDVGLPFEVAGAVRFDDQLQLHPTRLVLGFARAVHGDGSRSTSTAGSSTSPSVAAGSR
jgi:hypothetical protein